jgi:hypothetical protein
MSADENYTKKEVEEEKKRLVETFKSLTPEKKNLIVQEVLYFFLK